MVRGEVALKDLRALQRMGDRRINLLGAPLKSLGQHLDPENYPPPNDIERSLVGTSESQVLRRLGQHDRAQVLSSGIENFNP